MKFTVTEIDIYLIIREFCLSAISVALLSKSTPLFLYNAKPFAEACKAQSPKYRNWATSHCLLFNDLV